MTVVLNQPATIKHQNAMLQSETSATGSVACNISVFVWFACHTEVPREKGHGDEI